MERSLRMLTLTTLLVGAAICSGGCGLGSMADVIGDVLTTSDAELARQAINTNRPEVRLAAFQKLAEREGITDRDCFRAAALLAGAGASDEVRKGSLKILAQCRDLTYLRCVVGALADETPQVRQQARRSLITITGKDLGNKGEDWLAFMSQEARTPIVQSRQKTPPIQLIAKADKSPLPPTGLPMATDTEQANTGAIRWHEYQ